MITSNVVNNNHNNNVFICHVFISNEYYVIIQLTYADARSHVCSFSIPYPCYYICPAFIFDLHFFQPCVVLIMSFAISSDLVRIFFMLPIIIHTPFNVIWLTGDYSISNSFVQLYMYYI